MEVSLHADADKAMIHNLNSGKHACVWLSTCLTLRAGTTSWAALTPTSACA